MIKTNRGNVEMSGSTYELLADLTIIAHVMCYDIMIDQNNMTPYEAKRMIMKSVELGMKTEDEIEREHKDKHASAKDELLGMLEDLKDILRKAVKK